MLTTSRSSLWRRFWAKVRYSPGCWEWTGARCGPGYGQLVVRGRKKLAHRVSYALHNGTSPGRMEVMHACDNRLCVNPAHLSLGTHAENIDDREQKGRTARGEDFKRKLTEQDVRAIREARERGETCAAVADRFGVSPMQVSRVARRVDWSHVA